MKHLIDRALVWFKDGDDRQDMNYKYYSLSVLYTRLLREKYGGVRIRFINIHFKSEKTYQLFPKTPRLYLHFYNGVLFYNDVFDFDAFNLMGEEEKKYFIWSRVHEIMAAAARQLGNSELEKADDFAYKTGVERSLVADYKVLETELILFERAVTASVWNVFKEDGIYSYLVLTRDGKELYRKEISKGPLGNPFLLVMFKRILAKKDTVIVEYVRMAEESPIKIPIESANIFAP